MGDLKTGRILAEKAAFAVIADLAQSLIRPDTLRSTTPSPLAASEDAAVRKIESLEPCHRGASLRRRA
jgi:hypothetical protein